MGFICVMVKAYLHLLCYLLHPFPCMRLLPGQPTNVPLPANNPANSLTVDNNQKLLQNVEATVKDTQFNPVREVVIHS